jgi:hypothetical protein
MNLTCDKCKEPCNIDIEGKTDLPEFCPWGGTAGWREVEDEKD